MGKKRNAQQPAAEARAEIARREADCTALAEQAKEARLAFEAEPTPERNSAAVVAEQLSTNARKGLDAYRQEVASLLEEAQVEQDRERLAELQAATHWEADIHGDEQALGDAVDNLVAILTEVTRLVAGKAAAHNSRAGVIEELSRKFGCDVGITRGSLEGFLGAVASRLIAKHGATDDQGLPRTSGVRLGMGHTTNIDPTCVELRVRVPC